MDKILFLILTIFLLTSCDTVDDMKGMLEKQELAQTAIKERYGWESQLGFNITNGTLTQVTVVLDAKEVGQETVEHLTTITNEVVGDVFKSSPKAIYIQIVSVPSNEP